MWVTGGEVGSRPRFEEHAGDRPSAEKGWGVGSENKSTVHWIAMTALAAGEKAFSAKRREIGGFLSFQCNERPGNLENE